jgi:hypothetical protein
MEKHFKEHLFTYPIYPFVLMQAQMQYQIVLL